nr:hypothetical protein [Tanacetum cinerariifolium]
MEKIFDVMGCEDAFKTRLAVYKFEGNALAWWKAYKQAKGGDAWLITVTWADFKKLFFLQFFLRAEQERLKREAAAGTEEEQAKNFQWGLRRQKSGDRHQPTSQQSSHRNHGYNNDRHGSDRRSGGDNHRSNNNYSGNNNRFPWVPLRATPTQFALRVDADTHESVIELLADKKLGASGRVFAITEDHTTKTSGTITGTLFIYGHAVFVLFDTGATHSVISSAFASRVTTTPTLLDHVLCISTPMQDSVRITHVYRNLPLQFDDKIRVINELPLDMCKFDIILEHHATIDCRSYRVIFGDIHAPEFIYHGSLPGKSVQIISALQARTLLSHGCEGFLATIHDTTSDVPSIHDQPIVFEFPDVFPDELPGIPPVRE